MSGQLKEIRGIVEMRPYADRLNKMLINILSNIEGDASSSFGVERPIENTCLVIITSDRGLCGAFNTNILKKATATAQGKYKDSLAAGKMTVIPIGKKAFDFSKKKLGNAKVIEDYAGLNNNLVWEEMVQVPNQLMEAFKSGEYDHITVCYSKFKNAAMQENLAVQYLPVEKVEVKEEGDVKDKKADYLFEPNKETLLENLVPSILQTTFQKFLFDNRAGEHGARMTAMDKATENAEDLMGDLKIFYNKARQESITKELSEIVGGAAALGG